MAQWGDQDLVDRRAGPVPTGGSEATCPPEDRLQPLRRVARRFPTGVTVVATNDGSGAYAVTVNSLVTLSLEPPLVGFAIARSGRLLPLVRRSRWFGISILSTSQRHYATAYADRRRCGEQPGAALTRAGSPVAVPLVPGCLGYFVCAVRSIRRVGDHDLIVGEVVSCDCSEDAQEPLVFLNGRFRP